jgi:hypothetical protein
MRNFLEKQYTSGKNDVAFALLLRCLELMQGGAALAVVTPSNWTTIRSYRTFRRELLAIADVVFLYHVGKSSFQDMNWWALPIGLYVFSKSTTHGEYAAIECATDHRFSQKSVAAVSSPIEVISKHAVLATDAARVRYSKSMVSSSLDEYCISQQA